MKSSLQQQPLRALAPKREAFSRRIEAKARPAALPLSFSQERLWFLERIGLVGTAYTVSGALQLEGDLDVGALSRSFEELVRRHESLRTRFEEVNGQGVQVIEPAGRFELKVEDLTGLGSEEREGAVQERNREQAVKEFDLSQGGLMRVSLLKVSEQEHVLLLAMHHIVSDGWSVDVMVKELGELYAGYRRGVEPKLSALPVQYADYALWQREWLKGEVLEKQLGYWKEKLTGAPAVLELPTDRRRPAVPSYRGARHFFKLTAEQSVAVTEFARREGVTLFMVLLAVYQLLLSRWSGQREVVVGSPIAGRRQRELEGLIGFFVNTLVLRTEVTGEETFRQLLERVKETALGAYAHQDLPFERLVQELQPKRDMSTHPLFQTLFTCHRAPLDRMELAGLTLKPMFRDHTTAKFDLQVNMTERKSGIECSMEYATDLFEGETIERFAQQYCELLEAVIGAPQRKLSELKVLPRAEREQLLAQWNETTKSYEAKCVQELFEEQAKKSAESVAVTYEGAQLTYGELERRSNEVAHYLRGIGVGPEVVVGLCVDRSADLVVGMLAILKAGGAYLPLDPSYPAERLSYMLRDARSPVLLTEGSQLMKLAEELPAEVRVETSWQRVSGTLQSAPRSNVQPQNLAYVIYTSGSTGRPKGVMVEHRSAVNYLKWAAEAYRAEQGEGAPVTTSFSFDGTVTSLLVPLIAGNRVILYREDHDQVAKLGEALQRGEDLSLVKLTPTHLDMLEKGYPSAAREGAARVFVIGGEGLKTKQVQRWRELAPTLRLINEYGPTEATVGCSIHEVGAVDPDVDNVPIGRPIANTQLYVLDEELDPVPIGVVGELYIGGAGLARGYIYQGGLTAERFVANPYGEAGSRIYRTGDRVKYRADGSLEYLGRVDHQVKLRGYRIELGEIESTLLRYEGVSQAVVTVREDVPGGKGLVAYVVSAGSQASAEELREHVRRSLPEYMVPAFVMHLEQLPLTANGKVDRGALPAPEFAAERESVYVAPRTATEALVADVWAEVLSLERVGIHDNFFELGGHSIVAVLMAARIREVLGADVPVHEIFRAPTVEGLAARIEEIGAPQAPGPEPEEVRSSPGEQSWEPDMPRVA